MIYKNGQPISEAEIIELMNGLTEQMCMLKDLAERLSNPVLLRRADIQASTAPLVNREIEKYLKGPAIIEDARYMVSETFSALIDAEVRNLIDSCDDRIREIVQKRFAEFVEEKAAAILEAAFRDTRKRFLEETVK